MPGNPLTDPNWATDMTDTVVRTVGTVRDKATVPIVHAARAIVFGLLATFLGLFAFVLVIVGLTRGIQALLDLAVTQERAVYLSYLIVGGIFSLIGLLLFKKRSAGSAS